MEIAWNSRFVIRFMVFHDCTKDKKTIMLCLNCITVYGRKTLLELEVFEHLNSAPKRVIIE